MVAKKDLWRNGPSSVVRASGCMPITVTAGTVVINATRTVVISSPATYTPYCPYGDLPLAVHRANESIIDWFWSHSSMNYSGTPYRSWQSPYFHNIASSCFSISVATVGIWVLLMISFLFRTSWMIRIPAAISSGCFVAFSALMFIYLKAQFQGGFFEGFQLVEQLNDLGPSILEIVNTTVLLLAEVRTAVRLFLRRKEKRIILFSGLVLVITSQILSTFHAFISIPPHELPASLDAIIVISYLFSIATAILYACCVLFYSIIKWRLAYSRNVLLLAIISHASTFLPIVMFIMDLANEYLDSYSYYVKSLGLLSASVCVWLWIERVESIERELQMDSVLGRRCFAENAKDMDRKRTMSISYGNDIGPRLSDVKLEQVVEQDNKSTSSFDYREPMKYWTVITRLFRRPGTSSSSRTAYIVGPPGLSAIQNYGISTVGEDGPLEVHHYPLRRGGYTEGEAVGQVSEAVHVTEQVSVVSNTNYAAPPSDD